MQGYKKTYIDFFGFDEGDFIPSEVSGKKAVDIHHLTKRGRHKDSIWNLIALTRGEHNMAESDKAYNDNLKKVHYESVMRRVRESLKLQFRTVEITSTMI